MPAVPDVSSELRNELLALYLLKGELYSRLDSAQWAQVRSLQERLRRDLPHSVSGGEGKHWSAFLTQVAEFPPEILPSLTANTKRDAEFQLPRKRRRSSNGGMRRPGGEPANAPGAPSGGTKRKYEPLTDAERKHLQANNGCLYCREAHVSEEHRNGVCPKKGKCGK